MQTFEVQNAQWPCGHTHPDLIGLSGPQRDLAGTHPPDPGVCCQLTEDGLSVICSDGMGYNSQCPKCPWPNTPGYAKYQQVGSQLIPIPPTAGMCAGTGQDEQVSPSAISGSSILPVAVGLGAAALAAFFIFK